MLLVLAVLLLGNAQAGLFPRKTMQAPASDEVRREIVLPKGWTELSVGFDTRGSATFRDVDGTRTAWGNEAVLRTSHLRLGLAQGFSAHTTLYLDVPFVWHHLGNARGADVGTFALGDVHTGIVVQPWLGRAWKVAFRLDLKAPSGVEWPGDFSGGPDHVESFLTGTGVTNLGAFAHGALVTGRTRLELQAGYVRKFPAIVGYVVENDGFANGWIDPGDEVRVRGGVSFEVARGLSASLDPVFSWRSTYWMGVSGEGHKLSELYPVQGAGSYLDLVGAVDAEVGQVGLTASVGYQLLGSSTRMFGHLGLEEFAPHPGVTLGLRGRVRW